MHVITIVDIHPVPSPSHNTTQAPYHYAHIICTCGMIFNRHPSVRARAIADFHNHEAHGKDSPYKVVRIS